MPKIDQKVTKKISELAKLDLTDVEIEKFTGEISSVLDYIDSLNEVDTDDVQATSHIEDFVGQTLRADEVGQSMDAEMTMLNATDGRQKGSYFKTSKIVGGEE